MVATTTICSGLPVNQSLTTSPVVTGTTFTYPAPVVTGGITGGNARSTGSTANITDILINPTSLKQTATYTITPMSLNGCEGSTFTVTVTIYPKPSITAMNTSTCSGVAFTVTPVNGTDIVPANTIYSWSAPSVSGGLTGGTSGTDTTSISRTLNDTTNSVQTATYTVTPTSSSALGSCVGGSFPITVMINPKPAITIMNTATCSGVAFTETPANDINGYVPAGTTYNWAIPTGNGFSGGAAGSGSSITGTLTNTNSTSQIAVYTVAPTSFGACVGNTFNVNVTINPKPAINNMTSTICSGSTFTVSPVDGTGSIVPTGTTYSWSTPTGNGFTGGVNGSGTSITGALTNTTSTPQTAVYTVTPISGSCTGNTFLLTVTINPTPVVPNLSTSICSGTSFTVTPVNNTPTTIIPSGTTYTWGIPVSNPVGAITGGSAQATGQTNINQSLTNISSSSATLTYTVTPKSGNCSGANFNIVVIVNPIPTVSNSSITQPICSGESTTLVTLTSNVSGTTFAWTASASVGVSGFIVSGTNTIPNQTISTTGTSQGTVTYAITPTAAACSGTVYYYTVLVNPIPTVSNSAMTQTICSGANTLLVNLTSNVSGTTFAWTASASAGVSGFTTSGGNNTIQNQTISTTGTTQGTVTYAITPKAATCSGTVYNYTVLVNPIPTFSNSPMTQTICSGANTSLVNLTSDVSGATFAWTASAPGVVTGFTASGTSTIPVQTISTTGTTQGTVTYAITPTAASCSGTVSNYTVLVNPKPTVSNSPMTQTICSGVNTTLVNLTSDVSGTTFFWTASNTAGVSGYTASGTSTIPVQNISTTGTTQGTVTYAITPTAASCSGTVYNYTVVVNPKPTVNNSSMTQTICSGANTTLITLTSDVSGATFAWTATATTGVSGFFTSSNNTIPIQTISTTGTTQGIVTYAITPTAASCSGTVYNYTVLVNPIPTVSNSLMTQTVCSGINSTFVTLTPSVSGSTFAWTASATAGVSGFMTNGTTTIPVQTISTTGTTQGTVTYHITLSANNCSGTPSSYIILVNPSPTVSPISGLSSACSNQIGMYYITNPNHTIYNYSWTITGGTPTSFPDIDTINVTWGLINSSGIVTENVKDNTTQCQSDTFLTVPINTSIAVPQLNHIVAKPDSIHPYVLIYPNPPQQMYYQWYKDGIKEINGNEQFYYHSGNLTPGCYKVYVALLNNSGCGNFTNELCITEKKSDSFKFIPNPSNGKFLMFYEGETDIRGSSLSIFSVDGKIVYNQIINSQDELNMNLTLHHGFYFAKLTTIDGSTYTEKLIIK